MCTCLKQNIIIIYHSTKANAIDRAFDVEEDN